MRRERHAARLIAALTLSTQLVACSGGETTANYCGLDLDITWVRALELVNMPLSGKFDDGSEAFSPTVLEVEASTSTSVIARRNLPLFLDDELALKRMVVTVEGRNAAGGLVAVGSSTVSLFVGSFVALTVDLFAPGVCGNGSIEGTETCDDNNTAAGDGCADTCTLEQDWLCINTPSVCFPEDNTAVVGPASLAGALADTSKAVLFLGAGRYNMSLQLSARSVTIIGVPGTIFEVSAGVAINISSGAVVTLSGLTVRGGGIQIEGAGTSAQMSKMTIGPSDGTGITLSDGAALRLSESRVFNHELGGLLLDGGNYRVENVIVQANGGAGSSIGGVRIVSTTGTSRFVNNTVAENLVGTASTAAGVHCVEAAGLKNNLVWANFGGAPISALCDAEHSNLGPYEEDPGPLGTNLSMDPRLSPDLHLLPGSPCIDAGDDTDGTAPGIDIDGEPRPQGDAIDIGADEVSAQ
jgi:cysteine-rich repeat protein